MEFLKIFIVTVPLVIIHIYQFMVLLKSNLEKSIFFPFLLIVHYKGNCMSIEPVIVFRIAFSLIPLS